MSFCYTIDERVTPIPLDSRQCKPLYREEVPSKGLKSIWN